MDPSLLLILPFAFPLFAAVFTFFVKISLLLMTRLLLFVELVLSFALFFSVLHSGPFALSIGSWAAPYGIVLVCDLFAALMLLAANLIFFCGLFSYKPSRSLLIYPVLFLLQTGVNLSFLTGDFFNLFVAFEIMLTASYAIITMEAERKRMDRVYSYLSMNITASFLYLISVAVCYGYTGNLNFASLSLFFQQNDTPLAWIFFFSILMVLMIKSGIFPLYFWLADSYPVLPNRLGAVFGGILSKVGVYAFYRLILTVFSVESVWSSGLILLLACLTMFFGVLGAVSRDSVRGILSYHILSQVGYMIFALSLRTPFAIAAGIFFTLHNMLVKSSLFLIGGITQQRCGSGLLHRMGGLWALNPFLGILFLIQALSLAGIPPLSGFWGKYVLIVEGIATEHYIAVGIAVITSFFTLFSMMKIWNSVFIGEQKDPAFPVARSLYVGPCILAFVSISLGVFAGQVFSVVLPAAQQLLDPTEYISISLAAGTKGRGGS